MLLWYEECVEVPESGLDEAIRGHLLESHLKKYLSKLMPDFVQGMQSTCILICSE